MTNDRFRAVRPAPEEVYPSLYDIWERSVAATHDFLDPAYFEILKQEVPKAFPAVEHLYMYVNLHGDICGFTGVDGRKVEMLFVDPRYIGQGIGSVLFDYAVDVLGASEVDVNEQNTGGLTFYNRKGFRAVSRSETDPLGKPYPILTLRKGADSL